MVSVAVETDCSVFFWSEVRGILENSGDWRLATIGHGSPSESGPCRQSSGAVQQITIRNPEDDVKRRLRVRAAGHGRSMEEEAREILRQVVGEGAPPRNLAAAIRARVAPFGGADLERPAREPMRVPPRIVPGGDDDD